MDNLFNLKKDNGARPFFLGRHEIENNLIEPDLIVSSITKMSGATEVKIASEVILNTAQGMVAEARRASLNFARLVNRHFKTDQIKDSELETEASKWFDELDYSKPKVIQKVFPGKKLFQRSWIP